jgi:hypothetical protein
MGQRSWRPIRTGSNGPDNAESLESLTINILVVTLDTTSF